jgi:Zn-dependent protease
VTGIALTGFGGVCYWQGYPTKWHRAAIAWGGVLGQALLFGAAIGTTSVLGLPKTLFNQELFEALTGTNFMMAALNLLPVKPLDGAEAWRPLWYWFDGAATWAERVLKIPKDGKPRRKKRRSTKLRVVEEPDPVEAEEGSKPQFFH